jgi:hypothetical protein
MYIFYHGFTTLFQLNAEVLLVFVYVKPVGNTFDAENAR